MPSRIDVLLAERDELKLSGEAIYAAADKDGRDLTAEEIGQVESIKARIADKDKQLEAQRARREFELTAPAVQPAAGYPSISGGHDRAIDRPWASFGEQLVAIANAGMGMGIDQRLFRAAAASGMSSGVSSDGGFLVEEDYSTALLNRGFMAAQIAPRCMRIPIGAGSDGLEAPYIDETSRATGSRWGGVRVYRKGEADTVTASAPKFGEWSLRLEDMMGLAYATERLLRDSTALEAVLTQAFTEEFAFKVDDEILNGSGAGQCQGILNSAALVSVSKETGQSAATILFENVKKMRARLWARSRPNSVWLINQDIEPELQGMSLVVGTGGVPVYLPASGLAVDGFDTLYGRPVIPVEQCPTLGTVGDILLVDPTQYILIDKGGIQADQSIHVRFLYNERTFRWVYRINGGPKWKSALTPFKGSNTQSPYVALATRS